MASNLSGMMRGGSGASSGTPAQFWLPSLFRLDEPVCGSLQAPPTDGSDDASHWSFLKFLFSDVFSSNDAKIPSELIDFLTDYLDELNPTLTALLMAGYAVPSIEFGFPAYTLTEGAVEDAENPGTRILRIDLRTRQVTVNMRNPRTDGEGMFVRPVVLRLSDMMTVPSIDVGPDRLTTFLEDYVPVNENANTLRQSSAAMMLNTAFHDESGTGPILFGAWNGYDMTVAEQRDFVLQHFVRKIGDPLGAHLRFGVDFLQTATGSTYAREAGPIIREAVLGGALHGVFHAILWYVGQVLAEETVGNVDHFGTLPGFLWAFDPRSWDNVELSVVGQIDPQTYIPVLRAVFGYLWGSLSAPGEIGLEDPPNPGPDIEWHKVYGMIDALGYSTHLNLHRDDGLRCTGTMMRAPYRIIDLLIGGQVDFDRRTARKSNRKRPGGSAEKKNTFVKVNASLEGVLTDMAISLRLVPWIDENATDMLSARMPLNKLIDNFVFSCTMLVNTYSVVPGNSNHCRRLFADTPVFNILLALFNHKILSVVSTTGDLSEALIPDVIFTKEGSDNDPVYRLRHSLHVSEGITVRMANRPSDAADLPLERCFTWELIPPIRLPQTTNTQRLSTVAKVPAPNERLVIVAGPGVEISSRDGWPSQVDLEIYRVQSHALVPDPGERINLTMLNASYPISILDGMQASRHDYRTAADLAYDTLTGGTWPKHDIGQFEDLAVDQPECLPFVTVKPLQKMIGDDRYSGVQIATQMTNNLGYRGVNGSFAVDILAPESSGVDRFAFDIRHSIRNVPRVTRTETATIRFDRHSYDPKDRVYYGSSRTYTDVPVTEYVDIAQFEVVVHRTSGVRIDIFDSHAGALDWTTDVFIAEPLEWLTGVDLDLELPTWNNEPPKSGLYRIYDTDFQKVPVNGTPLETPLTNSEASKLGLTIREWDEIRLTQDTVVTLLTTAVDTSIGFIPIVGDAADVAEFALSFVTGCDRWGRPITNFDRTLMFGGMCLPFVGSTALRALKKTAGNMAIEGASGLAADVARHADDIDPPHYMDWIIDGVEEP